MARRAVAITAGLPRWPGTAAAVLVACVTLGSLLAVALRADGAGFGAGDVAAIRFTLWQAVLSALLSVGLAIPVARALARRRFRGRSLLITLLGAPFILPAIVAVIGLLAVFGRNGILSVALGWFGLEPVSIYGFQGVLIAHVFFNLPLSVRLILQGWAAIPSERFRLAASLGAPVGPLLEWPMLRAVVPGALMVVFLICLTSFAVALTLGGGPRATTVELAIYQALRFDFDLGRAAMLALVQFGLCGVAAVIAYRLTLPEGFGTGLDRGVMRWDATDRIARATDAVVIGMAALFLLVPLGMVVARGLPGLSDLPASIWAAAFRSVIVAVVSAGLTVAMALALAVRGGWSAAFAGALPLAASSLVMGTGLFLMVYLWINPSRLALPVTALVNATLSLPFALRVIIPAFNRVESGYGRLSDALGLHGWARLRIVILPRMRQPIGYALGLAAALSMGDLGVITLFAGQAQETLPLAMYRLMGAYQMQTAAGAALLLLTLSLALFWLFDRGGRDHAAT